MMKQGTNQAIRFFVMESLKELYRGKDNVNKPVPKPITGLFGVVAGAASVFGNTPLDVIKTRMQVSNGLMLLPVLHYWSLWNLSRKSSSWISLSATDILDLWASYRKRHWKHIRVFCCKHLSRRILSIYLLLDFLFASYYGFVFALDLVTIYLWSKCWLCTTCLLGFEVVTARDKHSAVRPAH